MLAGGLEQRLVSRDGFSLLQFTLKSRRPSAFLAPSLSRSAPPLTVQQHDTCTHRFVHGAQFTAAKPCGTGDIILCLFSHLSIKVDNEVIEVKALPKYSIT